MKRLIVSVALSLLALPMSAPSQEAKFTAETLVVQAESKYEAEPDLATLMFFISTQERQLRPAFEKATESMQRIVQLAERNGVPKDDVSTGTLTVRPIYRWTDRKQRARAYRVEGRVTLRVRDFARLGTLIDESVADGITDLRSLTYSLADEERAKHEAIREAMRRAESRARAALSGNSRQLGKLRSVNVEVKQPMGIVRLQATTETVEVAAGEGFGIGVPRARALPDITPERISVTATVQCLFQID